MQGKSMCRLWLLNRAIAFDKVLAKGFALEIPGR
jgi:hypothetical protein